MKGALRLLNRRDPAPFVLEDLSKMGECLWGLSKDSLEVRAAIASWLLASFFRDLGIIARLGAGDALLRTGHKAEGSCHFLGWVTEGTLVGQRCCGEGGELKIRKTTNKKQL